jgi:hypothetical protein
VADGRAVSGGRWKRCHVAVYEDILPIFLAFLIGDKKILIKYLKNFRRYPIKD